MLLIAENLKVLPQVVPRAGIEASGRLVKQQNFGMVKQSFGELDAALHPTRKSFQPIATPIEQSHAGKNLGDSLLQVGPAQAVKMSLMPKVFIGGELWIDALRLENDAYPAAQSSGLANCIECGDCGAARSRHHERG